MLIQENTLCSHKNLYVKRYSSFSHNFQQLETTKMFFNKWRNKYPAVAPCSGIFLLWNEQAIDLCNMNESYKHFAKWKGSDVKGYMLYDSIPMILLKRQSCRDGKQISGCQSLEEGKWLTAMQLHGETVGGDVALCGFRTVEKWFVTFARIHRAAHSMQI